MKADIKTNWTANRSFDDLAALIARGQEHMRDTLQDYLADGGDQRIAYQRYLTFQYHMTRGVQTYFMRVAASARLARMRPLRKFFVNFANEEELHYLVAASDLKALGMDILPMPFDVALWHAYFDKVTDDHPFVRVGAALILENISGGVASHWVKEALSAPFLTRDNTKFLVLHQHEALPHGDQLIEAIANAPLSDEDVDELILGAQQGTVLYMRMVDWALKHDNPEVLARNVTAYAPRVDRGEIERFRMEDLVLED
ncbi:MAG: hypothetical protein AAFN94_06555 [Pseudomonadota bacterium]